ncbi:MAG TPA: DUF4013 domain-containing protein [Thermomicrobiales bacterium]|jgi:hypothetical protein
MDLRRAFTYPFADSRWPAKLGRAATIACLPIVGQLALSAYAVQAIRTVATKPDDTDLPPWRLDRTTLMLGLKCQLLSIACALAAGLLTLPLWALTTADTDSTTETTTKPVPALIAAFHDPTTLLTTALMALFSSLCLARYATTGSAWAALDLAAIWSHLRAEPAIWIAAAVLGFAIEETPSTLAWLLPLPTSWQLPALLIATAFFWPFATLVQAHLIAQAYRWSSQTLARRRPLIVKVRW